MNLYPFTPDEVETYREGDCWVLARAVHDLTGWKVIGVGTNDHQGDSGYRDFCHLAVRTPHRRILDIEGSHTPRTFLKRWDPEMTKEHSRRCREWPCNHQTVLFEVPDDPRYYDDLLDGIKPSYVHSVGNAYSVAQRLLQYYIQDVVNSSQRQRSRQF